MGVSLEWDVGSRTKIGLRDKVHRAVFDSLGGIEDDTQVIVGRAKHTACIRESLDCDDGSSHALVRSSPSNMDDTIALLETRTGHEAPSAAEKIVKERSEGPGTCQPAVAPATLLSS